MRAAIEASISNGDESRTVVDIVAVAFVLFLFALSYVVKLQLGRHVAQRLRAIDNGALCPACNGTDLDVTGDNARCRSCGRVTNLTEVKKMTFDASTIANIRDLPKGGRDGPR